MKRPRRGVERRTGRPAIKLAPGHGTSITEQILGYHTLVGPIACRVCSSSRTTSLCETANEACEPRILAHRHCRTCGSVFVSNEIGADELGRAYDTIDWDSYYAEIESENVKKMGAAVEDLRHLERSARIIDVGMGNGLFLKALNDAGFTNLAGHEISDGGNQGIQGTFYYDHDYHSIPSQAFDCATLLDVVEHVPNPAFLLKACHRILKPGGFIYFHTPVVTSTDRFMHQLLKIKGLRKIGLMWQRGRTSIFHLQNYTPIALTKLLTDAGFAMISIRVQNELSWPVSRYVRKYLVERLGLPSLFVWLLTPLLYPLLKTDLLNANKAIVGARKQWSNSKGDQRMKRE